MVVSWLRSRIVPEARFLRHLQEGRWDKLVPPHQLGPLAEFTSRAAMTPGRDRLLLRFSAGAGRTEYLWAEYQILSADLDRCHLTLRTLWVQKEGHEGECPEALEDEPFFSVEDKRSERAQAHSRKAA